MNDSRDLPGLPHWGPCIPLWPPSSVLPTGFLPEHHFTVVHSAGAASLGVSAVEASGAVPVTHSQIAPGQKRGDASLLSHSRLSTACLSYRIAHLEGYE